MLHRELTPFVRKIVEVEFSIRPADADDVAQLVWVDVVRGLPQLQDPALLLAWVRTTTARVCLRWVGRRAACEQPVAPDEVPLDDVDAEQRAGSEDPAEVVSDRDLLDRLGVVMADLPVSSRLLVERLLDPRGLSYREIASDLQVPIGSIGPTRQRLLVDLRSRLAVNA